RVGRAGARDRRGQARSVGHRGRDPGPRPPDDRRLQGAEVGGVPHRTASALSGHEAAQARPAQPLLEGARGQRRMIFLHEVHRMVGTKEKAFEAAYREGWMPAVAEDDGARLLWFLHHAHGSGPSYQVVTITGLEDGAAWERLARRVHGGDLRQWVREVDECRHDAEARLLME